MSRHRNVRALNYDEEYDDYYDNSFGNSVEDEYCISPSTEAQFMYNRKPRNDGEEKRKNDDIVEENGETFPEKESDSNLSQLDKAKLMSCIDEMQNVVGDTIPEYVLKQAICRHNFNVEKALDAVLQAEFTFQSAGQQQSTSQMMDTGATKAPDSQKPKGKPKSKKGEEDVVSVTNSVGRFAFGMQSDGAIQISARNAASSKLVETPKVSPERPKAEKSKPSEATPVISSHTPKTPKVDTTQRLIEKYKTERLSRKPLINLIVIGHVDAGKSTLMGHLLFSLGFVSKKAMHRYETDSKKIGKSSFLYAWVLDETDEERSRGITMDIAQSHFETHNRAVTLLDAPGHKDFIPNMISGATQADVALLVVDATNGEFEAGFDAGGQTQEHTLLIRSLGVAQLCVVVNKLDNVNWNESRYQEIVSKLGSFLKQAGFKDQDVTFVPCSGLTGENLVARSKLAALTSWYNGPCLIEVIDSFRPPERPVEKPFRMYISDTFKSAGSGSGVSVSGKIESGVLETNQKLIVMPPGETCIVKSITLEEQNSTDAFAGDHVSLNLTGCDPNNIVVGNLLCHAAHPAPVVTTFQARIVIFHNVEVPLTKGFPVVLHCKSLSEPAVVTKLVSQLNKSTGEIVKKKPRCLMKNSSGVIELTVNKPVCLELYKDYKDLGRFTIRSRGSTVGAGMVLQVIN